MAEISSGWWIVIGAGVTSAAIYLNNSTDSLQFSFFVLAGTVMIVIGMGKLLIHKLFAEKKKTTPRTQHQTVRPAHQHQYKRCRNCGMTARSYDNFCSRCGMRL